MSRIRLVVPITPRREWGHGRVVPGMKFVAASPIVRIGSCEMSRAPMKDCG